MSGEKTKSFSKAEEKIFLKVGENFYPEREKKISPEIAQSHACDRSLEELRILGSKLGKVPAGKGVRQSCIFSPCLFNLYAEYIMQNARLDDAQAGIKTARRNTNNLRYADDITHMAKSDEEALAS